MFLTTSLFISASISADRIFASSVSASTITYTVERVCSAKYTPIQMRFINKNGMPQDHYFFLKNVETINTKSDKFKRNIFVQSTSTYGIRDHQELTFNKTGKKRFPLNTNYLVEAYNEVIQDIMLSEFVWINVNTFTTNDSANVLKKCMITIFLWPITVCNF